MKHIDFIIFLQNENVKYKLSKSIIDTSEYIYVKFKTDIDEYTLTFYDDVFIYGYDMNDNCIEDIYKIMETF